MMMVTVVVVIGEHVMIDAGKVQVILLLAASIDQRWIELAVVVVSAVITSRRSVHSQSLRGRWCPDR